MKKFLLVAVAAVAFSCSHKSGKAPAAASAPSAADAAASAHAASADAHAAGARSGANASAGAGGASPGAAAGAPSTAHAPAAHATRSAAKASPAKGSGEPKNLKVLPHSWSKHKLVAYMKHEVSRGLGVKCSFCHVKGNKASDKLKPKRTARNMMAMARALNHRYFHGKNRITCATCHHGHKKPTK